jgi:predicted  nucleic acid-binding Zn-ribbon protein
MIKKVLFLSICAVSLNIHASSDIVVKDNSQNTKVVQKSIVGCEEKPSMKQQQKDMAEIKSKLSDILEKLSAMEKESDSVSKKKQISNLKKEIKNLNTRTKNYVIVEVKRGDKLSDYAEKYYGDKKKYRRIYKANRDKIDLDMKIHAGDRLIIPLGKNYIYKRASTKPKIKRKRKIRYKKYRRYKTVVVHSPADVPILKKEKSKKYSMAKYIRPSKEDSTVKMLDEVVYIDDEKSIHHDVNDFIPLDEN